MTESRLDKIPKEVQLKILRQLSIQSLIRLYQTSHYWKHRISNDKRLWRGVYERDFGHEFAKDRWILWAIRRLWSQSSSEEKRLAARRVSLTTLEHLDGYTWYRLVRGRMLTVKNWRNNTPQRIIIFANDRSDRPIYDQLHGCSSFSYGIPIISNNWNKLEFGIIDDTLNDTELSLITDTLIDTLPLQTHEDNVVIGRIVPTYSAQHRIEFVEHVTNDEFMVVDKKISSYDERAPMIMLVWNIGCLEMHDTEEQSYCIPSLCMTELLPHSWWQFLEQQSGWLLMEDLTDYMNRPTRQCLLYDIRRGRLVMSFSAGIDMRPIIGKAAPDKVQIYYSHIKRISSDTITSESSQYFWHTIDVSIQSDISTSTADLIWYDQIPTSEAIETVRATYRNIMEYLLKTNSASEGMILPVEIKTITRPQHLIDDLFLLAPPKNCIVRDSFLLVHSLSQQHVIWLKNDLICYALIPEEKAIITYDVDGTVRLLNMYTGNVLNSFKLRGCHSIDHIIGPLCIFYCNKNMLIDVRTGEIVHTLKSDQMIQSWILPVLLPDMDPTNDLDALGQTRIEVDITDVLGPTRIEYVNAGINRALIFEYAQI
jgi:hypothetical protein